MEILSSDSEPVIIDEKPASSMESYDLYTLINALQNMTVYQAQLAVPTLAKYPIACLKDNFISALHYTPEFRQITPRKTFPFTPEEDFWLLTFLRLNDGQEITKERVLADSSEFIGNNHTYKEIEQRLLYLSKLSPEDKEKIIDRITKDIQNEKSFHSSTLTNEENEADHKVFHQVRCNYQPENKITPHNDINLIINRLTNDLPIISVFDSIGDMRDNDLAILRGRNFAYPIRREAIVLGRNHVYDEVDIDLSIDGVGSCPHISRKQAILSFLEDCNFYIENIGSRSFRVNGVEIKSEKMCRIPPYAILDFSDTLLMFIPNLKLINSLREYLVSK